jgi:hypothetical protein
MIHGSATPEHTREATTPQPDPRVYVPGGTLLADCSCGGTYTAPQGGDEYAALEKAHLTHVQKAERCPECGAPPGEDCASWCTGSMPDMDW